MPPVLAIEFTDLECKLLRIDRAAPPRPAKGGAPAAGPPPPAALRALAAFALPREDDPAARVTARAALLKETLKTAGHAGGPVHVVIPRHFVHSRRATLPATDDAEIDGMARFEAERHIPVNADRHVIGHHVLARNGARGSDVLLAAVDGPVADEYLKICVGAGLAVESLDVSAFALHRAWCAADAASPCTPLPSPLDAAPTDGTAPLDDGGPAGAVALVNIGLAATDIVLVVDGRLAYTRSASHGVARLLADVAAADPLAPPLEVSDLASIDALEPHLRLRATAAAGQSAAHESDPAAHPADGTPATAPPDVDAPPVDPNLTFAPFLRVAPPPAPPAAAAAAGPGPASRAFAAWQVKLLKEIRNTYEFARREFGCPMIVRFVLTGEGALIANLPAFVTANFQIAAATFDPFAALVARDAKSPAEANPNRPSMAHAALVGAVALATTPGATSVNLLPPEYLAAREGRRQRQGRLVTLVLGVTVLALGFVWVSDALARQERRVEELTKANGEMKVRVADLKAKKLRNDIVNQYIRDRHGPVEILDAVSSDTLFSFIPRNVTLKGFDYSKSETVKFTGYALTLPDANKMSQALERLSDGKSKFFEKVEESEGHNRLVRLPNRGAAEVLEMNINCVLPKRKKPKAAAPKADADDAAAESGGGGGASAGATAPGTKE